MGKAIKNITLGEYKNCNDEKKYDSQIISNIIFYVYGEKRTVTQIANKINMHPIKTVLYLDYMLQENIISCIEEDRNNGIERFFFVDNEDSEISMQTRVSGEHEIIHTANKLGNQLKSMIMSMNSDHINKISTVMAFLSEEDAKKVIVAQQELINLIIRLEENSKSSKKEEKKYMLISSFAPYEPEKECN